MTNRIKKHSSTVGYAPVTPAPPYPVPCTTVRDRKNFRNRRIQIFALSPSIHQIIIDAVRPGTKEISRLQVQISSIGLLALAATIKKHIAHMEFKS